MTFSWAVVPATSFGSTSSSLKTMLYRRDRGAMYASRRPFRRTEDRSAATNKEPGLNLSDFQNGGRRHFRTTSTSLRRWQAGSAIAGQRHLLATLNVTLDPAKVTGRFLFAVTGFCGRQSTVRLAVRCRLGGIRRRTTAYRPSPLQRSLRLAGRVYDLCR